jgi:hypothetical protein
MLFFEVLDHVKRLVLASDPGLNVKEVIERAREQLDVDISSHLTIRQQLNLILALSTPQNRLFHEIVSQVKRQLNLEGDDLVPSQIILMAEEQLGLILDGEMTQGKKFEAIMKEILSD